MSDVTMELAKEANDKAVQIARLKAENTELRESVRRLMTQRDERLARAEAENEKLREQVDAAHMSRLLTENENEKLRELVRLMVRRHAPISPCKNIPCGECPVKDECDQEDALMRELGIEVG